MKKFTTVMKIRLFAIIVLIGIPGISQGYDQNEELPVAPGIIAIIDICYPEIKKESEFGNKPERMQRFQYYDFKILEIAEKLNLYKVNKETGQLEFMKNSKNYDIYYGVQLLLQEEVEKDRNRVRKHLPKDWCEEWISMMMISFVEGYVYGATGGLGSMPGGLPQF